MKTSQHNLSSGRNLNRWIKRSIGFYLKEERLKQNYNIQEIAIALNTTVQSIEDCESGQNLSQWNTINRLLQLYHKNIMLNLIDM